VRLKAILTPPPLERGEVGLSDIKTAVDSVHEIPPPVSKTDLKGAGIKMSRPIKQLGISEASTAAPLENTSSLYSSCPVVHGPNTFEQCIIKQNVPVVETPSCLTNRRRLLLDRVFYQSPGRPIRSVSYTACTANIAPLACYQILTDSMTSDNKSGIDADEPFSKSYLPPVLTQ